MLHNVIYSNGGCSGFKPDFPFDLLSVRLFKPYLINSYSIDKHYNPVCRYCQGAKVLKKQSPYRLARTLLWWTQRGSIRATAVAWSLAVTTVHRTVALCRSSFEPRLKKQSPYRLAQTLLWWTQRGSNPRPFGCEPNALPN